MQSHPKVSRSEPKEGLTWRAVTVEVYGRCGRRGRIQNEWSSRQHRLSRHWVYWWLQAIVKHTSSFEKTQPFVFSCQEARDATQASCRRGELGNSWQWGWWLGRGQPEAITAVNSLKEQPAGHVCAPASSAVAASSPESLLWNTSATGCSTGSSAVASTTMMTKSIAG